MTPLFAIKTTIFHYKVTIFTQSVPTDGIRDFYVIILYPLHYCVDIITVSLGIVETVLPVVM